MLSTLSAVNVAMNVFDVRSYPVLSKTFLEIASRLLTTEVYYNVANSKVVAKAHKLLHNLYPDNTKFVDKKVCSVFFLFETRCEWLPNTEL